jgi:hypothetical protein
MRLPYALAPSPPLGNAKRWPTTVRTLLLLAVAVLVAFLTTGYVATRPRQNGESRLPDNVRSVSDDGKGDIVLVNGTSIDVSSDATSRAPSTSASRQDARQPEKQSGGKSMVGLAVGLSIAVVSVAVLVVVCFVIPWMRRKRSNDLDRAFAAAEAKIETVDPMTPDATGEQRISLALSQAPTRDPEAFTPASSFNDNPGGARPPAWADEPSSDVPPIDVPSTRSRNQTMQGEILDMPDPPLPSQGSKAWRGLEAEQ